MDPYACVDPDLKREDVTDSQEDRLGKAAFIGSPVAPNTSVDIYASDFTGNQTEHAAASASSPLDPISQSSSPPSMNQLHGDSVEEIIIFPSPSTHPNPEPEVLKAPQPTQAPTSRLKSRKLPPSFANQPPPPDGNRARLPSALTPGPSKARHPPIPSIVQQPARDQNQPPPPDGNRACLPSALTPGPSKAQHPPIRNTVHQPARDQNFPANLLDVIQAFSKKRGRSLSGDMDILEIAAMKGIEFPTPRWWRPGGYDH